MVHCGKMHPAWLPSVRQDHRHSRWLDQALSGPTTCGTLRYRFHFVQAWRTVFQPASLTSSPRFTNHCHLDGGSEAANERSFQSVPLLLCIMEGSYSFLLGQPAVGLVRNDNCCFYCSSCSLKQPISFDLSLLRLNPSTCFVDSPAGWL